MASNHQKVITNISTVRELQCAIVKRFEAAYRLLLGQYTYNMCILDLCIQHVCVYVLTVCLD